jgi:anion-transporting  ArsA/GET3 family ATPase
MRYELMGRVIVCCGSGGVGKTTTAAALGLALADQGLAVAVLTIDPAKRLADALGVGPLGNHPQSVPLESVLPGATGSLDAMMLDMKATFDAVIRRYSPDSDAADRILVNHYYQYVSTRLAGSHEYMAMERVLELHTSGNYDVLLVDTPPTRHALDFLSAPERMSGVMNERVMRWLTLPGTARGFRVLERGSRTVMSGLKRLLGSRTITDIAEFFTAFQPLWTGFRERSLELEALLHGAETTFLLVSTPSPAARSEAREFLDILRQRGLPFGGLLINRVAEVPAHGPPVDRPDRPADATEAQWHAVLNAVCSATEHQQRLADGQQEMLRALRESAGHSPVWLVPQLATDVHDLDALRAIAAYLTPVADVLARSNQVR